MIKSILIDVKWLCFPKYSIDDCMANTWSKQSPPSHDDFEAMTSCSMHSSCLGGDVIPAGRDVKAIHLSSTYPPRHSQISHTNTCFFPMCLVNMSAWRLHVWAQTRRWEADGRTDGWMETDPPPPTSTCCLTNAVIHQDWMNVAVWH